MQTSLAVRGLTLQTYPHACYVYDPDQEQWLHESRKQEICLLTAFPSNIKHNKALSIIRHYQLWILHLKGKIGDVCNWVCFLLEVEHCLEALNIRRCSQLCHF